MKLLLRCKKCGIKNSVKIPNGVDVKKFYVDHKAHELFLKFGAKFLWSYFWG